MALSDTKIERALRKTVGDFYAEQRFDDLTVKRVRAAAAEKLGLEESWFKTHEDWNARSKEVISSEVTEQESSNAAAKSSPPKSPVEESKPVSGSRKRRTPEAKSKPRKRTKVEPKDRPEESSKEDSGALSSAEQGSPPRKQHGKSKPTKGTPESSPLSDVEAQPSEKTAAAKNGNEDEEMKSPPAPVDDKSESELSSLIDEAPKKRKPRETKKKASSSAKPAKKKSSGTKTSIDIDPQEAEIKKLQSWLLKCGIRKLWHRELAPYDTPRAKISHLKGLLEDIGMTGRFSEQKAREIKEQREMAADLEAITEGNRHWGKDKAGSGSEDSEQASETRGKRLAKGLRDINALIGDDDGEETD